VKTEVGSGIGVGYLVFGIVWVVAGVVVVLRYG
jgi:hypothetical protein